MKRYSREELLPEIVGEDIYKVSKSAVKQSIYRIDKIVKKMTSDSKIQGIPEDKKDQYVNLMRNIYNNPEIKKIMNKIDKGSSMTDEEYISIYDFLVEGIEDPEEKAILEYHRREFIGKELKEEINSIYTNIIEFTRSNVYLPYEIQIKLLKEINQEINNYMIKNEKKINFYKSMFIEGDVSKLFPTTEELKEKFEEFIKDRENEK